MTMIPILETSKGKLYEEDCMRVMQNLDSDSVDLVFADPPFNLGKEYASNIDDAIEEEDYLEWSRNWIDEAIRILKPGGAFFHWNLPKWNLALGFHTSQKLTFRHWIAVEMKYSLPIQGRLYPSHYSLLYFIKGKKPAIFHPDRLPTPCCRHCGGEIKDYGGYKNKMNPKGVSLTDVWTDIPPVRHKRHKRRVANALSVKLMDRIISLASDKDSLVFDPFGGSGTTYAVAELLGRRWIGAELHCQDIISRFDRLDDDLEYLKELHANKNRLFTSNDLKRMKTSGRKLSEKYNLNNDDVSSDLEDAQLPLFEAS